MSLFPMDAGQTRVRLVQAGAALLAAALLGGCGSAYRPVITPINPNGPAAQPQSLAAVVSLPSPTSPGIATIIDYSGDTIMATLPVGLAPVAFAVDGTGSSGYTLNSDGTLTTFEVSINAQEKNIRFTTLPTTSRPVGMFAPSAGLWLADLDQNVTDVLTVSPATFKLAIPVAPTPITVTGISTIGQHIYSISQNNSSTPLANAIPFDVTCNNAPASVSQVGEADSIEISSYTVSARIPVGKCPVYGVASSDGKRVYVLNRGSDTITVINSQNNSLDDQCPPPTGGVNQNGQTYFSHPALPLSTAAVSATGIHRRWNHMISSSCRTCVCGVRRGHPAAHRCRLRRGHDQPDRRQPRHLR